MLAHKRVVTPVNGDLCYKGEQEVSGMTRKACPNNPHCPHSEAAHVAARVGVPPLLWAHVGWADVSAPCDPYRSGAHLVGRVVMRRGSRSAAEEISATSMSDRAVASRRSEPGRGDPPGSGA